MAWRFGHPYGRGLRVPPVAGNEARLATLADDVHFFILNPNPGGLINLEYTLSDLKVYKDLPIANFEDDFSNTSAGTLVFWSSSVVIAPGNTLDIPLGALAPGSSYALAGITTLTVRDLDTGSVDTYTTEQMYGQTRIVPEPSSALLIGLGVACAALVRVRRRPVA